MEHQLGLSVSDLIERYPKAINCEAKGLLYGIGESTSQTSIDFLIKVGSERKPFFERQQMLRFTARQILVRHIASDLLNTCVSGERLEAAHKVTMFFRERTYAPSDSRDLKTLQNFLERYFKVHRGKTHLDQAKYNALICALVAAKDFGFLAQNCVREAAIYIYYDLLDQVQRPRNSKTRQCHTLRTKCAEWTNPNKINDSTYVELGGDRFAEELIRINRVAGQALNGNGEMAEEAQAMMLLTALQVDCWYPVVGTN